MASLPLAIVHYAHAIFARQPIAPSCLKMCRHRQHHHQTYTYTITILNVIYSTCLCLCMLYGIIKMVGTLLITNLFQLELCLLPLCIAKLCVCYCIRSCLPMGDALLLHADALFASPSFPFINIYEIDGFDLPHETKSSDINLFSSIFLAGDIDIVLHCKWLKIAKGQSRKRRGE